jgi:hypothetical protein
MKWGNELGIALGWTQSTGPLEVFSEMAVMSHASIGINSFQQEPTRSHLQAVTGEVL